MTKSLAYRVSELCAALSQVGIDPTEPMIMEEGNINTKIKTKLTVEVAVGKPYLLKFSGHPSLIKMVLRTLHLGSKQSCWSAQATVDFEPGILYYTADRCLPHGELLTVRFE